jgi:hypothetical protein
MKTYIISGSDKIGETGCTEKRAWLESPVLQRDTAGNLMTIVLEFEAETREEAMQKYNDHYGYGKYIPMDG